MNETRGARYGRNLARLIDHTIETVPAHTRDSYRLSFLEELRKYPLDKRKKGQPETRGCIHELKDIEDVQIYQPKELAKLVKEGIHLMYQKSTSLRVLRAFLDYFESSHQ